jgi:hypothetical protein
MLVIPVCGVCKLYYGPYVACLYYIERFTCKCIQRNLI